LEEGGETRHVSPERGRAAGERLHVVHGMEVSTPEILCAVPDVVDEGGTRAYRVQDALVGKRIQELLALGVVLGELSHQNGGWRVSEPPPNVEGPPRKAARPAPVRDQQPR